MPVVALVFLCLFVGLLFGPIIGATFELFAEAAHESKKARDKARPAVAAAPINWRNLAIIVACTLSALSILTAALLCFTHGYGPTILRTIN